ncbi:hypothetical protein HPB58_04135 [Priestia filamentosa]|uniref:hypothetical protein n=1 Tax=Priestia filamentosa TaxID=1402861 RepID=UPI001FB1E308|nr:hypothetical protein [Priestia filamentosa]MED3725377.1 hypothetical protein [Priestia filamentosa]UOE61376.1 hypothetical protein HPB58_04135 [Priestia filamentosa]
MDTLIDFLLSNIVIVIAVLGFIWGIIQKALGKTEEQRERQPVEMKEEQKREVSQPHRVEETHSAFEREREEQQKRLREAKERYKSALKSVEKAPTLSAKTSSKKPKIGLSRKKAVEGMIWSEILGKPRAKRKHNLR